MCFAGRGLIMMHNAPRPYLQQCRCSRSRCHSLRTAHTWSSAECHHEAELCLDLHQPAPPSRRWYLFAKHVRKPGHACAEHTARARSMRRHAAPRI
jgi:hypothetical protein